MFYPELPKPDFLYEQGAVMVVNKPSGLLTQAPPGIDSMELRIKSFLKRRDQKPGKVYVGVPHRLDRPASGAMVFVKNVRAARRLTEQFQARTVTKTYWAVVAGNVREARGNWTDWMRKVPDEARSELVTADHPDAQLAELEFRVVGRADNLTWLEINLGTGRTHQIRLQAAGRGHPIVGDALYGSERQFGPVQPDHRLRPIALHARRLAFEHPITHEPVDIVAPVPDVWRSLPFAFPSAASDVGVLAPAPESPDS